MSTRDILETWLSTSSRWSVELAHVELTRGHVFQVCASWRGPGDEPEDGEPDQRTYDADYYDAATLELARAIALEAVEVLKRRDRVDLRAIARAVKRRHPELQSLTRTDNGAVLLGDTPPDEAA